MTLDSKRLIAGYLDETLAPDEHAELNRWLKANLQNAQEMAEAMLLHDRLRSEHLAASAMGDGTDVATLVRVWGPDQTDRVQASLLKKWIFGAATVRERFLSSRKLRFLTGAAPSHTLFQQAQANVATRGRSRTLLATFGAMIAASLVFAVLWRGLGESSASAAVVELNRIITANAQPRDRTYRITVEEVALPVRRDDRAESPERRRPPKPPMEGARLQVRGGQQFVLVRTTTEGLPFVTGSNGQTSWAVRPDGPVRFSSDLTRFSHDLPGNEHSMPLNSIPDGLERLRAAYDVQLLPVDSADDEASPDAEPSRLLVAVKKPGFRGPKRVEITYSIRSSLIRQMRFVEMPYGPERLTLRMTLVDERQLGANFFDHESHHAPDRTVEEE